MKATDFIRENDAVAQQLGIGRRDLFDTVIDLSCAYICMKMKDLRHLYEDNVFDPILLRRPKLNTNGDLGNEKTATMLITHKLRFVEMMKSAEPFEDVITPIYAEAFLSGVAGQFMSPSSLGVLLQQLVMTPQQSDKLSDPYTLADQCVGTGALALGSLRSIYEQEGKVGVSRVNLWINDIDLRLVKIALFQIMFHSIQHGAPLGGLMVETKDIIRHPELSPDSFLFHCKRASPITRESWILDAIKKLMEPSILEPVSD